MALSIYISLTIVLLHFAYYIRKPLNFLQNSLIFMVIAIITRQCLTVMGMEWKLYKLTEDDWLFVCLLLCRDILTPMVTVIFCNFYFRRNFWFAKLATFVICLAALLGLNYMAVRFGIITYTRWNFGFTALLNILFMLVALGIVKLISYIQIWEKRQNESL
ncbi:hypothetical protein AABM38_21560 [Heyndrickxia sp. MSNUG]|uniref:hypothetical protein n=1 Tax=Heyndrickxia sp. MSNUG TaxID=3136677 RepID=UPI003C2D46C0